ncbi:hypothetical protein FD754_005706, partial [Muntiacus muntjak]
ACENDPQCGGGMCCAVSIWVKSIRICTPLGKVGDSCHPMSHKLCGTSASGWVAGRREQRSLIDSGFRSVHHSIGIYFGESCGRV